MSKKKAAVLDKIENMSGPKGTKQNVITNINEIDAETLAKIKFAPGRPADPNSERQIKLKEMDEKRKKGELKRGRPADPNSPNYKKRLEAEARKADPNYVAKRGRPVDPNSDRHKKVAQANEKKLERIKADLDAGKQIILQEVSDDELLLVENEVESQSE